MAQLLLRAAAVVAAAHTHTQMALLSKCYVPESKLLRSISYYTHKHTQSANCEGGKAYEHKRDHTLLLKRVAAAVFSLTIALVFFTFRQMNGRAFWNY